MLGFKGVAAEPSELNVGGEGGVVFVGVVGGGAVVSGTLVGGGDTIGALPGGKLVGVKSVEPAQQKKFSMCFQFRLPTYRYAKFFFFLWRNIDRVAKSIFRNAKFGQKLSFIARFSSFQPPIHLTKKNLI